MAAMNLCMNFGGRPMMFDLERFREQRLSAKFRDGREAEVVKQILGKAEKNPESVLRIFNEFTEQQKNLMIIGNEKGAILAEAVASCNPMNSLELGTYLGYSGTMIGSKMPKTGKLISMEKNPSTCDSARKVVNHAGLSDRVVIVEGILEDKLEEVKEMLTSRGATKFDLLFLDHWGSCYLPDFLLLKEHGLVAKGTTIVADNMLVPEIPTFRKYVEQHSDDFRSAVHKSRMREGRFSYDEIFVISMLN